MARLVVLGLVLAGLGVASAGGDIVVVDFDDLDFETVLTGTAYAGLTWDTGTGGYQGHIGQWVVPEEARSNYPVTGPYNVTNEYGDTWLGIGFPEDVTVVGAYFAGQGSEVVWTTGVRVHGYHDGELVAITDWFTNIDDTADWFPMDLVDVDHIVIESLPAMQGGGWYGMDNLTYAAPEPGSLLLLLASAGTLVRRRRR